jgi:hypothetical protein
MARHSDARRSGGAPSSTRSLRERVASQTLTSGNNGVTAAGSSSVAGGGAALDDEVGAEG